MICYALRLAQKDILKQDYPFNLSSTGIRRQVFCLCRLGAFLHFQSPLGIKKGSPETP